MRILVAVDLSEASARVVEAAGRVAMQSGADVFLLHVAEPNPDFVGYEAGPEVVRSQLAEEYRKEHRAIQEHADRLREAGISATALLVQGPTVATTLEQAEKLEAALIVVGSHGHGALYDVLVGSYSAGILRKAKVPVLVVPTRKA